MRYILYWFIKLLHRPNKLVRAIRAQILEEGRHDCYCGIWTEQDCSCGKYDEERMKQLDTILDSLRRQDGTDV